MTGLPAYVGRRDHTPLLMTSSGLAVGTRR
jgi:hypothetical protein